MPRSPSPCGHVFARDRPIILHDIVRQFPAAKDATPAIEEILLVPFHRDGVAVWAIRHDRNRVFDREDLRRLQSLSQFASAPWVWPRISSSAPITRRRRFGPSPRASSTGSGSATG